NTCTASNCTGTCASGFADCNNNFRSDGCEINTNTNFSNCGGCNAPCSGANMATSACTRGNCTGTCPSGFADCNANLRADGCEINTNTNPSNCGGCGSAWACPGTNMSSNTCTSGSCTGTCTTGFANCDSNFRSNGCEINTNTNPANCGGCNAA